MEEMVPENEEVTGSRIIKRLTFAIEATYNNIQSLRRREAIIEARNEKDATELPVKTGSVLENRYRLDKFMGKGSFGSIYKAYDDHTHKFFAIKIIKDSPAFRLQSQTEVQILKMLNRFDPHDQWGIVRLYRVFYVEDRFPCLVFELLSANLYEVMMKSRVGFSLELVRRIGHQILMSLYFLSTRDIDIVHCDLKPENILLRADGSSKIKLIDFGSSCFRQNQSYTYIQSRFYRAPEVLFGYPYDQSIDMWSFGCIMAELHTCCAIFPAQTELDLMNRISQYFGYPQAPVLGAAKNVKKFFDVVFEEENVAFAPKFYRPHKPRKPLTRNFSEVLRYTSRFPHGTRSDLIAYSSRMNNTATAQDYNDFEDLIRRCLTWNASDRLKPWEALHHPFFMKNKQRKRDLNPNDLVITGPTNGHGEPVMVPRETDTVADFEVRKIRPKSRGMPLPSYIRKVPAKPLEPPAPFVSKEMTEEGEILDPSIRIFKRSDTRLPYYNNNNSNNSTQQSSSNSRSPRSHTPTNSSTRSMRSARSQVMYLSPPPHVTSQQQYYQQVPQVQQPHQQPLGIYGTPSQGQLPHQHMISSPQNNEFSHQAPYQTVPSYPEQQQQQQQQQPQLQHYQPQQPQLLHHSQTLHAIPQTRLSMSSAGSYQMQQFSRHTSHNRLNVPSHSQHRSRNYHHRENPHMQQQQQQHPTNGNAQYGGGHYSSETAHNNNGDMMEVDDMVVERRRGSRRSTKRSSLSSLKSITPTVTEVPQRNEGENDEMKMEYETHHHHFQNQNHHQQHLQNDNNMMDVEY